MGLFSSIAKIATNVATTAKTLVTQPVKSFVEGAKATANIVANPITAITQGYQAAAAKTASSSLTTNIAKIVTNTAIVAIPLAKPSLVTSAAKALIPSTPKAIAVTAIAAPVAIGAITANPIGAAKAVTSAPAALANVGSNVATFASNPSVANAKNIFTENPITAGALVGAGALIAGKAAVTTAATLANTIATEKNTAAVKAINAPIDAEIPKTSNSAATEKEAVAANNNPIPQTPQTTRIVTTSNLKNTRKRRRIKPQSNINQKVNIYVDNDDNDDWISKRYIKRGIFNH